LRFTQKPEYSVSRHPMSGGLCLILAIPQLQDPKQPTAVTMQSHRDRNAAPIIQPSPSRRFQFHLRTLMIGVTLFCVAIGGYIGWNAKIVRERNGWRTNPHFFEPVSFADGGDSLPLLRRLLGDAECFALVADGPISDADLESCQAAFPEARISRESNDAMGLGYGRGSLSMHMTIHTFRDGTCKIVVEDPSSKKPNQ
jgi:hypothetical protein